jgi:hypothetical protein
VGRPEDTRLDVHQAVAASGKESAEAALRAPSSNPRWIMVAQDTITGLDAHGG